MHYLSQIENPQLAFSVKQQKLDTAVSATLELESYLPSKVTTLRTAGTDLECPTETKTVIASATTKGDSESTSDRMEVELRQSKQVQPSRRRMDSNSQSRKKPPVVCWNCNRPDHIARNCRLLPPQGNVNPYTD